jgi:glycosyltransferase involved in cell wall biosynthesis
MASPLVAIGIPTYNRALYLRDAFQNALAQTYEKLEILVVDNASTDRTREILESFADSRIRYVRNAANLGMVGNFNPVLALSTGDYLTCLCDDDWLAPRFVEACLGLFRRYPDLGLVPCPAIACGSEGRQ